MNYGNNFRNICDSVPQAEHQLQQTALEVIWWSNVICLPTIAVIGLACNLLNILILSTNSSARRIPSWDLLLALAVCDCLFLIFATMEVTPTSISPLITSSSFTIVYIHSALYVRMLASTFYKSSVLLVVTFNVERYICVCHPMRAHNLCSNRTSRIAILICLTISLLCSVQWPICYRTRPCWDYHLGQHFYVIAISDNLRLQKYYRVMDYFTLVVFNVLPVVVLCILNSRLIVTLRKVVDRDLITRRSFASDDGAEDSINGTIATTSTTTTALATTTRNCTVTENGALIADATNARTSAAQRFNANAMLFAVVIMLLVCVGPQAPARLLFDHYGQYHLTAIAYTCITQQLVFLNAALNFCLYCLVSRRYRQLMAQTVKRLLGKTSKKYRSSIRLKDTTRNSSLRA